MIVEVFLTMIFEKNNGRSEYRPIQINTFIKERTLAIGYSKIPLNPD